MSKAVILARGLGTRMRAAGDDSHLPPQQRALADAGAKSMLSFGAPFIEFVVSALADAGFRDICLVIRPHRDPILEWFEDRTAVTRVRLHFAVQAEARGTADAVLAAEPFIGADPFVVLNADNYYPVDVLRELREQSEPALPAFERETLLRESNIPAERIAKYALLEIENGYLTRIVEKPDAATAAKLADAPISMNVWRLTREILAACRNVPVSSRGEFELPQAVQWAIQHLGYRVRALPVSAGVLDLSQRADIPAVAERLRGVSVRL